MVYGFDHGAGSLTVLLEGTAVRGSRNYEAKVEPGIILVQLPLFSAFFPSQGSFPPECRLCWWPCPTSVPSRTIGTL